MSYRVLFLCGLFPPNTKNDLIMSSKGVVQNAADALQYSFVDAIKFAGIRPTVISLPFVGSFPKLHSRFIIKSSTYSDSNIDIYSYGFVNIKYFKHFSRFISALWGLSRAVTNEKTIIISYSMHLPFVLAAVLSKFFRRNIKISLIIPDLPDYMGGTYSGILYYVKLLDSKIQYFLLNYVDSFVLLTDSMAAKTIRKDQPWVRIEGISSHEVIMDNNNLHISDFHNVILYTGTLDRRYGINLLLDAFSIVSRRDVKLVVCGDGNALDDVIEAAKVDDRIVYLGQLRREDIRMYQLNSSLLINPRTSEGEYTKYSFPSKVMEYFSSGTPVIMFRLPGIPEEYYKYCIVPDAENKNELAKAIELYFSKSISSRKNIGNQARNFILSNKSPFHAGLKLKTIINETFK